MKLSQVPKRSLYVDETGTPGAPSVVFLHGVGVSGWMWAKQTAALADFHCLTVDLPGHGRSNCVPWVSLAETGDQVAALIRERATAGRAHVVGLSLGGYVALALLERHSQGVDHVVMTGVTAAPMPNRALLTPQLWLLSAVMKRRWFAEMQARSMRLPPDMQAAFTESLLATSLEAYRRIYREAADFHLPDALRSVETPTLVIAGSRESDIITQAVDAIPALMPNAVGRLAPGVGHGWNVEAPDLFNTTIRAWISDTPLPDRLQPVRRSRQDV